MSDVLVRVSGACGRLTLNRPRAINALTSAMVTTLYDALLTWAHDPAIHFVLLDGAGERGLCAGGDVRAVYDAILAGDLEAAAAFFRQEYRLNYLISRYPKPYIALMDGIVMGGGLGVSAHGSHRVVTERSQLAMPETLIGFVPDVGGTFLLGRAPEEMGTYLGLTGHRIGAADAIACGLADRTVPGASLPALIAELEGCPGAAAAELCLDQHTPEPAPGLSVAQQAWIRDCFAASTVEDICAALAECGDPEAKTALEDLEKRSPTSLKVTLAALRRGRARGELSACLDQEFFIAQTCLRGHDFPEGVRAALVNKDRNPQWQPVQLAGVRDEDVQTYFAGAGKLGLDLSSVLAART